MVKRELYTFGETTARKLQDWAHRLPAEQGDTRTELDDYNHSRTFKAPEGGIPAATTTKAGSAMCKVVEIAENDDIIVTQKEFKVRNWTKQAVCATGDRYGEAVKDGYRKWKVIAADCSDTG